MPEVVTNKEQIEVWNEKSGPKWVAMQQRLDLQLEPFSTALFDSVQLKPGERVLDIGCGCGVTTLTAATQVGKSGHATGADISRPMLQRARERANADALNNAEFVEADAQTFAFAPADADAVISRFGVMFFADPTAAFTNIRRALKPGGRMAFVCWRMMSENPWMLLPMRAAAQHIEIPPPPPDPFAPGPFALADAERTRGILTKAGFGDAKVEKLDLKLAVGGSTDFEKAVDFAVEVGPLNSLLMDKPDAIKQAVRASVREALKPFLTPNGVIVDWAASLVSAANG